jgi:hypothetical protein
MDVMLYSLGELFEAKRRKQSYPVATSTERWLTDCQLRLTWARSPDHGHLPQQQVRRSDRRGAKAGHRRVCPCGRNRPVGATQSSEVGSLAADNDAMKALQRGFAYTASKTQ